MALSAAKRRNGSHFGREVGRDLVLVVEESMRPEALCDSCLDREPFEFAQDGSDVVVAFRSGNHASDGMKHSLKTEERRGEQTDMDGNTIVKT